MIFSFHEQHHNNSFLCASLLLGQSNLAAGSTIGSNHNSRGADGEIIAGRGFWPGLCVSLKHNSIFSSFIIIAKGNYSAELKINIPFSLVSNDVSHDKLIIMPAYWFLYNMYALERNAWKYSDRDKRVNKIQHLENNYLAPDTISEIINSLHFLEEITGASWHKKNGIKNLSSQKNIEQGKILFQQKNVFCNTIEVEGGIFENSKRPAIILKALEAYDVFKDVVLFYATTLLVEWIEKENIKSAQQLYKTIPNSTKAEWLNIGGQMMLKKDVEILKGKIKSNKINSWDAVHQFYKKCSNKYETDKLLHALGCLQVLFGIKKIDHNTLSQMLNQSINTKKWMVKNIETSREKDYNNEFRKMVYDNENEMNSILGILDDNSFIKEQKKQLKLYISKVEQIKLKFKLK